MFLWVLPTSKLLSSDFNAITKSVNIAASRRLEDTTVRKMSVKEVSGSALVKQLVEELKKMKEITPPEWSRFVKTGTHKERPPEQPDWWYTRAASLLRRIFIDGPVGVQRLRSYYGGHKKRGVPPEHFRRAGGKILRTLLQQLEKAGLVAKTERGGRKLTAKGANMLTAIANRMKTEETKTQGE